jgi:hypothetical protein
LISRAGRPLASAAGSRWPRSGASVLAAGAPALTLPSEAAEAWLQGHCKLQTANKLIHFYDGILWLPQNGTYLVEMIFFVGKMQTIFGIIIAPD